MASFSALVVAAGCSKSPYELAHVSGRVVIDGKPFAEGKVMFAPIATGADRKAGRAAFGKLAADGSYSLATYEPDDGAVVGDHWVTLIHVRPDSSRNPVRSAPADAVTAFTRVGVPQKVTVAAGQDNKIDLVLSRQQIVKYGMFKD